MANKLSKLLSDAEKEPTTFDEKKLAEELANAIKLLHSEVISTGYRNDLFAVINLTTDLISHLSTPSFPVAVVLEHLNRLRNLFYNLEQYVRKAQITYTGFCVVNNRTNKMLPTLYFNYADAAAQIEVLAPSFSISPRDLSIVSVNYASTTVSQPLEPVPVRLPPPTEPPIDPGLPISVEEKVPDLTPSPSPAPIKD